MANPGLEMKPFHFKQFSLFHHNSTMKIGTDTILLSAWCDADNTKNILDIGTGCGIIALLMASRTDAIIDAIELDINSSKEADTNFKNSEFSGRLNIIQGDFMEYVQKSAIKYELIISNPPFFSNDLKATTSGRNSARHIDNLNYDNLCKGVVRLLTNNGRLCLVLPYVKENEFIIAASKYELHLHKKLLIYPKPDMPPNRINMEFRLHSPTEVVIDEITIRDDNNQHTIQYKEMVKNYLVNI